MRIHHRMPKTTGMDAGKGSRMHNDIVELRKRTKALTDTIEALATIEDVLARHAIKSTSEHVSSSCGDVSHHHEYVVNKQNDKLDIQWSFDTVSDPNWSAIDRHAKSARIKVSVTTGMACIARSTTFQVAVCYTATNGLWSIHDSMGGYVKSFNQPSGWRSLMRMIEPSRYTNGTIRGFTSRRGTNDPIFLLYNTLGWATEFMCTGTYED